MINTKKNKLNFNTTTILLFFIILNTNLQAQLAKNHIKFLGNILNTFEPNKIPADFSTYWNQITPGNAGKWESVESTRNIMNWEILDDYYKYTQENGFKFKGHTLIWGSQYPKWMHGLTQEEQKKEIEEWMTLYAQRYPNTWAIDVVNEAIVTNFPFKNALGGKGNTGWDWVIWSFETARRLMPNTKLIINETGSENNFILRGKFKQLIRILNSKNLIDGVGLQCHAFSLDMLSSKHMQKVLDEYEALGVDVYISELDLRGAKSMFGILPEDFKLPSFIPSFLSRFNPFPYLAFNDERSQRNKYKEIFPILWSHPAVKGITLWGYEEGKMWIKYAGLINPNGKDRKAMTWLKEYMNTVNPANPFIYTIRAKGISGTEKIRFLIDGVSVQAFNLTNEMADYTVSAKKGKISVAFFNDSSNRDVQVDYIKVGEKIYQSENQKINTGVCDRFHCGGKYSEWLHRNGYIEFSTILNNSSRLNAKNEDLLDETKTTNKTSTKEILNTIYPNPSNGNFTIKLDNPNSTIEIFNLSGQLLKSFSSNGSKEMNTDSKLNPGRYIVKITGSTGNTSSIIIIE